MRTIKFRAKNEFDGFEWIYGYYFVGASNSSFIVDKDSVFHYVNPETVGQFTGLPSQDKEDIYEGDRLFDYDDDYYVVEFSEGRFVAVGDGFEVDLFEIADRCSVIGNVHDNPELLKGDK